MSANGNAIVLGASTTQVRDRLLLAAEVKVSGSEVTGYSEGIKSELDESVFRVGGEYLAGEILVGRLGFAQTLSTDKTTVLAGDTVSEHDLDRSTVSTGIGVGPVREASGSSIWPTTWT